MLQTNERLYLKRGGQIPEDDTRGSCLLASLIFTYTCIHTYVPLHISNKHEYMHMHSYTRRHTHTCLHTHTHICTYSHMHAYTHTPATLALLEKQGQVDSLSQSSQSVSSRFSERSCLTMLHGPTCVCTCVDTHYTHAQREGNSVKK